MSCTCLYSKCCGASDGCFVLHLEAHVRFQTLGSCIPAKESIWCNKSTEEDGDTSSPSVVALSELILKVLLDVPEIVV